MIRLLERLNYLSVGPHEEETARDRVIRSHHSVVDYIRKLLNVRRGSVAVSPKMGMPYVNNFDDVQSTASQQALADEIKTIVLKYHGDVANVEIKLLNRDQLSVMFRCSVLLSFKHTDTRLRLLVQLQADSTYEVTIHE